MSVEFSPDGYLRLLSHLADHGYETVTFSQLPRHDAEAVSCVLRHDVDASLDFACRFAELEAGRGVKSTYFIMLRSPLYNALSRQGAGDIRQLASLGHDIGLHFDGRDGDQKEDIERRITRDMAILGELAGTAVSAFSFHQPTEDLLARRVVVGGAINAYSLDELGFHYVSDSNRNWRGHDVLDLIRHKRRLQLLLHPMWWMCDAPDVFDCWDAALRQNLQSVQRHLMAAEGAYGPERRVHFTRAREASAVRGYLAPLTEVDLPLLFSWINDRSLAVFSAPFHPVHETDHVAWFRHLQDRKDAVIFGIRRGADDQLVGTCQLHAIDAVSRSAELRIRIGVAEARGTGIGTDACRALMKHAFEDLNLSRVFLQVLDDNTAARRLYEKVGFEVEGVAKRAVFIDGRWRDVVMMACRRPDRDHE